jgi:hypothetical protein
MNRSPLGSVLHERCHPRDAVWRGLPMLCEKGSVETKQELNLPTSPVWEAYGKPRQYSLAL